MMLGGGPPEGGLLLFNVKFNGNFNFNFNGNGNGNGRLFGSYRLAGRCHAPPGHAVNPSMGALRQHPCCLRSRRGMAAPDLIDCCDRNRGQGGLAADALGLRMVEAVGYGLRATGYGLRGTGYG